jgi:choline-sulfatase
MTNESNGAQRPNILYIQSDQHNPNVTGCYGETTVRTPNLDALAARGTVFTNAYCASPLCVPSRISLLTGRYPYENEVWGNSHTLSSGIPTYAHAMGAAGYRPVQVGRMHFIGYDQLHGFAERYVGDHISNYFASLHPCDHGMLRGADGPTRTGLQKSGYGQSSYQILDENVAAATVDYINRLGIRKRGGLEPEPFSISVGFMLPHPPFVARKEDYDQYVGKVPMPRIREPYSDKLHPYFQWWRKRTGIEEVTDDEIMRSRTAYWGLVTRTDALVGQLLEALRRNGFEDNTMVIYSTDHGEHVGEHDLWWKTTFYEESARVPAIVSWPGVLPEGGRCDRVINHFDLNATMLDAVGAPPLPRSRGRSMIDLLKDPEGTPWEDVAFSEFVMYAQRDGLPFDVHSPPDGSVQRMVRYEEWKLNYYHGMRPQLFNLAEDPDEMNDLAEDPAYSSIRDELIERVLDGWDPDEVTRKMAVAQQDQRVMTAWARNVEPPDNYRAEQGPEMDFLDGP